MTKYSDFFLVTSLCAAGIYFSSIESDEGTNKKTFVYESTKELFDTVDAYYRGLLMVDAKKLWQEYTNLKSIIHNKPYLEQKYGSKNK